MSEKELPIWEWLNDRAGTALVYVNNEHRASARAGETGYFKANPSDQIDVYDMVGTELDSKPAKMELPFVSGTPEELAKRYQSPTTSP